MLDMNTTGCQQVRIMMDLQDRMNRVVNEDWIDLRRPWYRPAWIEAGELMNHLKVWKWWGTPHPDYEQVELEIVDIMHFLLSSVIEGAGSLEAAKGSDLIKALVLPPRSAPALHDDTMNAIERFVSTILAERRATINVLLDFVTMASCVGVTQDRAYRLYIGKNALNIFRQKNGYKTGNYMKIWDGREDNEHLAEIAAEMDMEAPDVFDQLMARLDERYRGLCAA